MRTCPHICPTHALNLVPESQTQWLRFTLTTPRIAFYLVQARSSGANRRHSDSLKLALVVILPSNRRLRKSSPQASHCRIVVVSDRHYHTISAATILRSAIFCNLTITPRNHMSSLSVP